MRIKRSESASDAAVETVAFHGIFFLCHHLVPILFSNTKVNIFGGE